MPAVVWVTASRVEAETWLEARRNHERASDQRGSSHDAVNLEHFSHPVPVIVVPPGPFTVLDAKWGRKVQSGTHDFSIRHLMDALAAVWGAG